MEKKTLLRQVFAGLFKNLQGKIYEKGGALKTAQRFFLINQANEENLNEKIYNQVI